MTMQQATRICGNCGKPIGADDVICSHCDALLAAYEAPAGATTGSSAAIDPVDMTSRPVVVDQDVDLASPSKIEPERAYDSPTAQSLDALDAHKPQAGTISTTFDLPEKSPVAEALRKTRIAADLDAQGERSAKTEQGIPPQDKSVPRDPRQFLGMSAKPASTPVPQQSSSLGTGVVQSDSSQQEDARERLKAQREARKIAAQATEARPVRPTPEERARSATPPVQTSDPNPAPKSGSTPGIAMYIGIVFLILFVARLGGSTFSSFLFIPVVIGILIWFMTRVAKNTGRKTTSMPRDKRDRR